MTFTRQLVCALWERVVVTAKTVLSLSVIGMVGLTSSAYGETYYLSGDNDPSIRAAQFYSETGQPFAALSEAQRALLLAPRHSSSSSLQQSIRDSVAQLSAANLPAILEQYALAPATANDRPNASSDDAIYRRYNHAVELLNAGNAEQGISALEELVEVDYVDEDKLLLRDKTHLALGYYYLEDRKIDQAREHFREVRRLSPYANRALIGFGWALLQADNPALSGVRQLPPSTPSPDPSDPLPSGSPFLWSGSDDDIAWARRRAPYRRAWAVVQGEMREDLRRAIVPWMELIAGDPLDPAVQEGMLIIPYAMIHMGDFQKAQRYYSQAQDSLRDVHNSLNKNINQVANGEMVTAITQRDAAANNGWNHWLAQAIADPDTSYIELMIGNPDFLNALHDYRELTVLSQAMERHLALLADVSGVPAEVLVAQIKDLLSRLHDTQNLKKIQLEEVAILELKTRQKQVETYIAEAGFALARLQDSPRTRSNPSPGGSY